MEKDIETLLETITKIVNVSDTLWIKKREAIKRSLLHNEEYDVAFDEFISWFEQDEE